MNQRTAIRVSIEAIDPTLSTQTWDSESALEARPAPLKTPPHFREPLRTIVYFETVDAEAAFFMECSADVEGCRVYRAANRIEFYRLALTVNPALIVLSSAGGKREAIELIGDVRDIPTLDDIPVVFLSDIETERSVRTAFSMGVTRYILRPPLPHERFACILALLSDSDGSESRIDAYEVLPDEGVAAAAATPGPRAWLPVKAATPREGHVSSRYPWVYRRFAESPRFTRAA